MSENKLTANESIVESPADSDGEKKAKINPEIVSSSAADVKESTKLDTTMGSISTQINTEMETKRISDQLSCFNWSKRVDSPPTVVLVNCQTDEKTPKPAPPCLYVYRYSIYTQNPVLTPEEGIPLPLPRPVSNYRLYEQTVIDVCTPPELEVKPIDYSSVAEEKIIPSFLSGCSCYDVIPTDKKVIILNVKLLVKDAFNVLVEKNGKAAALWDSKVNDLIGLLTISDFINILRYYYYSSPCIIMDLENQSIESWRNMRNVEKSFVKLSTMDSLEVAAKLFIKERVHRIPVINEKRQDVTFVLTLRKLLEFLSNSLFDNFEKTTNVQTPSFFRKTLRELGIGTFEDIVKVHRDTKVINALDLLMKHKVSALPVVDKEGVLLDIFEKFDVFKMTEEKTYHNLDMPISDAINLAGVREMAWTCALEESFGNVMDRFVNKMVHQMVVIDEKRVVIGIISLSDIVKFLVVDPMEKPGQSSTSETIVGDAEGAVGGSAEGSSVQPEPSDGNVSFGTPGIVKTSRLPRFQTELSKLKLKVKEDKGF